MSTREKLDGLYAKFDNEFMQLYVYEIDEVEEYLTEEELQEVKDNGYEYAYRLSANGYLDCTDWYFATTLEEVCEGVDSNFIEPYEI